MNQPAVSKAHENWTSCRMTSKGDVSLMTLSKTIITKVVDSTLAECMDGPTVEVISSDRAV